MAKDKMIPFEEVAKKWRKNPEYIKAYNALEAEYAVYEEMIKAQMEKGITQKDVAERMGTSVSALSRMLRGKQPPSWNTILRFADAIGKRPVLQFVEKRV